MAFKEYKGLNLSQVADEVLAEWEKNRSFEKSISLRKNASKFIFYEGPPSANGMPGIHHVMARSIKDIFCRYKTLKGFQVDRKAGWDTHGLPIELSVEKDLGITKEDIGTKISVEDYNKACKKAVMKYTDVWNDLTKKMGYWVDMSNPYVTYKSKYIESVWWLLKELFDKNLIYKGYTIQPYSPKAGTGLSSHELNQPGTYQDVSDTTVTAQFKAINSSLPSLLSSYEDLYFLAWTTTPWTLPSNTALTVGAKIKYSVVSTFNQYTHEFTNVVLASDLVSKVFSGNYLQVSSNSDFKYDSKIDKKIPYLVNESINGNELVGIKYYQLWEDAPLPYKNAENAFRIIEGDFVTTEDGTGIVHTAPTFGADDAKVAKMASPKIPALLILDENEQPVPLVDLQGKFRKELGFLGEKFVKNEYYEEGNVPEKSVDVEIAIKLKEQNKAFKVEKYVHSYPNCWRTDKPILYYPLDSWFIKVTDKKEDLVELNKSINWKPKSTGEGRFGNWLANANDWNLSRSRYWGIPLPIWRTSDSKEVLVIGSMKDLKTEIKKSISKGFMKNDPFKHFITNDMSNDNYDKIDLHKNVVDQIILCSEKGEKMYREPDLIDVWFDSGSMPYAQWHYPFENKNKIDNNEAFPADYIAEGVDQTRGWFYTLTILSVALFDSVAFKNCITTGMILAEDGRKMSKSLKNYPDPEELLNSYGGDSLRAYLINSPVVRGEPLKFSEDGVQLVTRNVILPLWNSFTFFSNYANADEITMEELSKADPVENRPLMDQWIISTLQSLIKTVNEKMENYYLYEVIPPLISFIDELTNWYVRSNRKRFWKEKGVDDLDKINAFKTLHEVLLEFSKTMAPVLPFICEQIYQGLVEEEDTSIHYENYPVADNNLINTQLEKEISTAKDVIRSARNIRLNVEMPNKQPLRSLKIVTKDTSLQNEIKNVEHIILNELNVKEIIFENNISEWVKYVCKPNYQELGPKLLSADQEEQIQ